MILLVAAVPQSNRSRAGGSDKPTTLVNPPWTHTLGLNRVGQTHLDFYSGYRKKFSRPQGIAAVKLRFNDKEGPGDDDELTVYGVNQGSGEIFYNKSMVSLGFFGREGTGDGKFSDAVGISANELGDVFVADRGNDRVVRLANENNELRYVGSITLAGSGKALRGPCGVAVEGDELYIADTGNDRLVVCDFDGQVVRELAGPADIHRPFAVSAISSSEWNFYGSSFVVVTDSLEQRLLQIGTDGGPVRSRRIAEIVGTGGGFFFVAIDYYSNIYVTDTRSGCIYKFDRYLTYLTRFGCGTGTGDDLVEPRGITIHRRFGQVFVAEKAGASYFWVGTDVRNLSCAGKMEAGNLLLEVRFLLTEQSDVSIRVETEDGKVVKHLRETRFMAPGYVTNAFHVNGDSLPCPVAKCKYVVAVRANPTYSSKRYVTIERRVPVR